MLFLGEIFTPFLAFSGFSIIIIIMTTFGHRTRRYEGELMRFRFPDVEQVVDRTSWKIDSGFR
jgi:hypothetical protein